MLADRALALMPNCACSQSTGCGELHMRNSFSSNAASVFPCGLALNKGSIAKQHFNVYTHLGVPPLSQMSRQASYDSSVSSLQSDDPKGRGASLVSDCLRGSDCLREFHTTPITPPKGGPASSTWLKARGIRRSHADEYL